MVADLLPGDVLLYAPSSIFGALIRIHTWHSISHVEIYIGHGDSAASRDGIGVGIYPLRAGMVHILRPTVPFDLPKALTYIQGMLGTPYGWWDLLNFTGWSVQAKGIVCSPFVTEVLRAAGVPVFNADPAVLIAPFEFLDSELLAEVSQ